MTDNFQAAMRVFVTEWIEAAEKVYDEVGKLVYQMVAVLELEVVAGKADEKDFAKVGLWA